jgi:HD-GYP domain-containing protein (c-di-GMP phosphodiesterase class II)
MKIIMPLKVIVCYNLNTILASRPELGKEMENKLQLILQVSSELAKEKDLRKILVKLTNITQKLVNADRCSIFLHDKKREQLWTIAATGIDEIRIPQFAGIAGYVFKSSEIVNIPDAYADERFDKEIDRKTGYRTRNILTLPIVSRSSKSMGVFQVINKLDDNGFTKEDIELLKHIILYADSTIDNALLYETLKQAQQDIILRLSNATRYKDPETQYHITRVGLYCSIMARQLGWSEDDIELIRLASPMHDIGKVGVPDRILLKPGKLDDEEWKIMRMHTTYGYEILQGSDSKLVQLAQNVALDHHEKWDGSGYPNKKSGEEISIHGRMCAIADVFDALTSVRPYKKAWPLEKTLALIKEESGNHFDPQLCDIFLGNIDDFVAIKNKYRDEE